MPTTTSNMSLKTPIAGETDYATSLSDTNTAVDAHDHSSGKGVPIVTGGITDLAVTTAKIADLNVTTGKLAANVLTADATGRGKMADGFVTKAKQAAMAASATAAAGELGLSTSCGAFSGASASAADITNLTLTLVTTGRPVHLSLVHDGSTGAGEYGYLGVRDSSNATLSAFVILKRDSTEIARHEMHYEDGATAVKLLTIPLSSISHIDAVAGGSYTYKVQYLLSSGDQFECNRAKLVAYEL